VAGRASGCVRSGQTARRKPNPDQLAFQLDGADHPRCGGHNGVQVVAPVRPSPATVRAKRAEIARHYDRSDPKTPVTWNRRNLRRKELRVVHRLWNEAGRCTVEIDKAIADGGSLQLSGREIGDVLSFTLADYRAYGEAERRHPATIRPYDATDAERKAYLKAFHRPRKSAAKRQRYAKRRAAEAERVAWAADLDCRRSSIWVVLDDKWQTVAEIMKALPRSSAFCAPDGKRFLTGDSLSKAIRRELEHLALGRMIEITQRTGKRGLVEKLVRRRGDVS
jgi:hypothetical protein